MSNKAIKEKMSKRVNVPKPTTKNMAGGKTYDMPLDEQVLKTLMVGTTANTYYMDSESRLDEIVNVLSDPMINPEYLAKCIVYARNEGFNRELPILGLVALSKVDPKLFRAVCSKVLRNPHDWEMFIDMCRSGATRDGMGRAIKSEMCEALAKMPYYHVLKYPTAVFDMVNVCRPNPKNVPIAYYVKNGGKWKEYVAGLNDPSVVETLSDFIAYDALRDMASKGVLIDSGWEVVAKGIKDYNIPYESATSFIGKNPICWKALFDNAPYFNMIRNLNNFIKYDAINNDNVLHTVDRIANREAVAKSMMYPFRFYQAWRNLENRSTELSEAGFNTLKLGIERAMQFSLDNVPNIPGKCAIATDCSGSMSSNVNNDKTDITCIDIAGIFSAILKMKNKDNVLLPFDDCVRPDIIARANKGKSIPEIASAFRAMDGTSLAAPINALRTSKVSVDYFIGITDNMEWIPAKDELNSRYKTDSHLFLTEFMLYQKEVNPDVQAYLITIMDYQGRPAPAQVKNVNLIYGWTDSVLKLIGKNFNTQVDIVKNSVI